MSGKKSGFLSDGEFVEIWKDTIRGYRLALGCPLTVDPPDGEDEDGYADDPTKRLEPGEEG